MDAVLWIVVAMVTKIHLTNIRKVKCVLQNEESVTLILFADMFAWHLVSYREGKQVVFRFFCWILRCKAVLSTNLHLRMTFVKLKFVELPLIVALVQNLTHYSSVYALPCHQES